MVIGVAGKFRKAYSLATASVAFPVPRRRKARCVRLLCTGVAIGMTASVVIALTSSQLVEAASARRAPAPARSSQEADPCPDLGTPGSAQAGLIQELCNIDGFLAAPVDPVSGADLSGTPYAGTTAVLASYLATLSSETAGGAALSPAELDELANVVDVLNLVVDDVDQTASETPLQIAQANQFVDAGEWGIAYEVSDNIAGRFYSAAGSVLNFAETIVGGKLGDAINDQVDAWMLSTFNQASIGVLTTVAQEVDLAQSVDVGLITNTINGWVSNALDLQAVTTSGIQTFCDLLLSANGYEIDLRLAPAVTAAEQDTTAPASGAVSDLLSSDLDGPADVAISTDSALDSLYSNSWLNDIVSVLELIPFLGIGTLTAFTADTAAIGGDIGNALVDANYLYSPNGIPVPGTLLDTLLYGWDQAVGTLLGTPPPPPSDATAITVSVPDTDCCQTSGGTETCEAGALVSVTGVVTDSGTPVPDAEVQLSSSAGSLTASAVTTAADGAYTAGVILPAAVGQSVTVTASVPGSSAPLAVATVTVGAGPPYGLYLFGQTSVTSGTSSEQVDAFLSDVNGNGISGVDVDLSATGGTVSPSSGVTDSDGFLTATVSIPSGATQVTVTASAVADGIPLSASPLSIAVVPAAAPVISSFSASPANVGSAGGSVQLSGSRSGASSCTVSVAPALAGFPMSPSSCSAVSVPATIGAGTSGEQTYTFELSATGAGGTTAGEATVTQGAPLTVGSAMPDGVAGQAYDAAIPVSGGIGAYSVTVVSGSPPSGTTLSPGGVLQGTPTGAGTTTFQVDVTDAVGDSATASITIVIQSASVNTSLYEVSFEQEPLDGVDQVNSCSQDPWSVTLNGVTGSCSQSGNGPVFINFEEPDGTYSFTVTAPDGFNVTPASGTITVAGSPYTQLVAFTATSAQQTWTENVVSGESDYVTYQSLACGGPDCYGRGVETTSATSYGLALWPSADGGTTWTAPPYSLPGVNLVQSCDNGGNSNDDSMTGCVVAFGSTAYALGPEGATSGTDTSAFWSTTNGGGSWTENTIASNAQGFSLACANIADCYVVASAGGGTVLYGTSDAGQQWSGEAVPGGEEPGAEMACPDAGTCIIASTSGVIETTDSGASWQQFGPAGASGAVSCPSGQVCWLSAGTQVWVTTDLGSSWTQAGTLPAAPAQMTCLDQTLCIAAGSNDDVYVNTYGTTWTQQTLPNLYLPYSAAFTSAGGAVLGLDQDGAVAVWTVQASALVSTSTATSITAVTPSPVAGQPVSVRVQVASADAGAGVPAPTGTVTVADGAGQTCSAQLTGSAGVASGSCTITEPAGTYSLTASYSGDAYFTSSETSAPTALTVTEAATSTSITAVTPNPVVGQPITIDVQTTGQFTEADDP